MEWLAALPSWVPLLIGIGSMLAGLGSAAARIMESGAGSRRVRYEHWEALSVQQREALSALGERYAVVEHDLQRCLASQRARR